MPIINYLERLQRIDQLIRLKATGTPRELADKLEAQPKADYLKSCRVVAMLVDEETQRKEEHYNANKTKNVVSKF